MKITNEYKIWGKPYLQIIYAKIWRGIKRSFARAVLSTAIITIFSTDLGSKTENVFFCISRPHSTGWSISTQEARLRLQNGLKLEGEPGKHRDVIHQGRQQESAPDYESLHTPIMGNKWLPPLPKGFGASCGSKAWVSNFATLQKG